MGLNDVWTTSERHLNDKSSNLDIYFKLTSERSLNKLWRTVSGQPLTGLSTAVEWSLSGLIPERCPEKLWTVSEREIEQSQHLNYLVSFNGTEQWKTVLERSLNIFLERSLDDWFWVIPEPALGGLWMVLISECFLSLIYFNIWMLLMFEWL